MTFKETLENAQDGARDAAESVNDAAKNFYEKAKDMTHDVAENIEEPAKNLHEVAKEQLGKITDYFGEKNDTGNLFHGLCVGVASILFVYGVCKAVSYFQKPKKGE